MNKNIRRKAIIKRALPLIKAMKIRAEHVNCGRNCGLADWFYCQHGTFVGSAYGPDYLCGWCEDGISDYDYALMKGYNSVRDELKKLSHELGLAIINVVADNDGFDVITNDCFWDLMRSVKL